MEEAVEGIAKEEDEDEEIQEEEDDTYPEEDYNEGRYFSNRSPYTNSLAYQNNEDYLDLVQELEETLQNRSRNRVHRTMREFEHRSRYNKPLEKPIINYDETSESEEPIIQKICYLTDKKRKKTSYLPCKKPPNDEVYYRPGRQSKSPRPRSKSPPYLRRTAKRDNTHWQLDQKTGEWYKVKGKARPRKSRTPSPLKCSQRCDCSCGNHNYR